MFQDSTKTVVGRYAGFFAKADANNSIDGKQNAMPTVSQFFGIVIQMFWREHSPPHFHALYGEFEALIDIRTLEVIGGNLPRRALHLAIEWAVEHRGELMEDWNLCQAKQLPNKIPPLE